MRPRRFPARVYFIKPVGMEGPVKIGCSALPERRLIDLTIWSPFPLEIVASLPGNEDLEWRFHAAFASDRSHSEWFHGSARLTAVMAAVANGTFDIDTLPPAKRLPYRTTGNNWSEFARLSASMGARIKALEDRGVAVPREIRARAFRYANGQYHGETPRQPEDAEAVQRFLALHGYTPRPIPAALPANDTIQQGEAA